MNRRAFLPLVAFLCALMMLVGCSAADRPAINSKLNPKQPATVVLWHYYNGEIQRALNAAVSDFNQSVGIQRGVIVETVAMGSIRELEDALTEAAMGVINAPDMPQIFSSYTDKALEIAALGQVVELNTLFSKEEQSEYVPSFLENGQCADGRLLVLPVAKSTELLFVNDTAWRTFAAETGHSEENLSTWESVYETARAYYRWMDGKTPNVPWDGKAMMGLDSVSNYFIIACKQLGVELISADKAETGRVVLDKEVLRRVFEPYCASVSFGYFGAVGRFRSDDVKAGELIAYVGPSSSGSYFPTWIEKDGTQQRIDLLALPYPVFSGGETYAVQQGAGMSIAPGTPEQQEGAALFLKWFTDSAQNVNFALATGYLPAKKRAYGSDTLGSALDELRKGEKDRQNLACVYEVALCQVAESGTYAAMPFARSYDVRTVLQTSVCAAVEKMRAQVDGMKTKGMKEVEILANLNQNAYFEAWLEALKQGLEQAGVRYVEQ